MPRNLNERVEVMVRLEDARLKQRMRDDILSVLSRGQREGARADA